MVSGKESTGLFDDLLFPKIFRTFRVALQPTKLIITFLAVAVICLSGWVMDFSRTVVVGTYGSDKVTELDVYIDRTDDPGTATQAHIDKYQDASDLRTGVFSTLWHFGSTRFHTGLGELFNLKLRSVGENARDCIKAITWAVRFHYVYCLILAAVSLAVLSVAGGAVCRIAALQFAQDEKPGLTEAISFSLKRFKSFFTAPLAPILIMLFMGLFVLLLGVVGNIPYAGELIVALGMPLALALGALMTVILVGAVVGLGLMFPAVAYDGSDCFDSISRSLSYVYAQPARMASYSIVAAIYGAICYIFVRFFTFLLLLITHFLLRIAIWTGGGETGGDKLLTIWPRPEFGKLLSYPSPAPAGLTELWASRIVCLFVLIVIGLMVSFIVSFYFSANTVIYSLMRKRVDNTDLNEVCTHFDEAEAEILAAEIQGGQEQ